MAEGVNGAVSGEDVVRGVALWQAVRRACSLPEKELLPGALLKPSELDEVGGMCSSIFPLELPPSSVPATLCCQSFLLALKEN